jgi:hypothetical protein
MKKVLLAVVIGAALGFAASAATSGLGSASAAGSCGPRGLVCGANQECCVSPGPRTYTCVPAGHCRWN